MNVDELQNDPKYKKFDPEYVEFAQVDDIWVRAYTVPRAQMIIAQHVHVHDHITFVSQGAVEAWQNGELLGEFVAPSLIKIPAGKKHAFKALTDDVCLCCLHNLRGTGLESPEIKEV